MRIVSIATLIASAALAGALYACGTTANQKEKEGTAPAPDATATAASAAVDPVKRGEYLVNGMGCDDCHSPKRMGAHGPEVIAETRLSGYPADRPVVRPQFAELKQGFAVFNPDLTSAVGPWGVSFAANITPDETGIGAWTEQNFITAMRKGKAKGMENNRDLLPPMPWYNFAKLNDDDLKAMFAYLKSLPPVKNQVPAPQR